MKLTNKRVLTAVSEVTYGVDPGGGTGMLASNFSVAPMAANIVKRARAYPTFGMDPVVVAQKYRTLSCEIEMAGSGAAGTAPKYAPMLKACGMQETINAGVSAVYSPVTSAPSPNSASLHFFNDALAHAMLGTRGTCSLKLSGAALPIWTFSMSGLYAAVTDQNPPDVHSDLEAFLNAGEVNLANTTCSLFGQPVVLESLTIDVGNTVIFRDRPNSSYIAETERNVTGTIVFEAVSVGTFDWFGQVPPSATGALALTQGTTAGNEVQVAATKVQIGNPSYTDLNGVLGLSVPLYFLRTAGDDEITFTVK